MITDVRKPFCWKRAAGLVLLVAALAGCSSGGGPGVVFPDETCPILGKSRPNRHAVSSLVVSTPTWLDPNLASGDDGAVRRPSGYTLYDVQGLKLDYVRNYLGTLDREPTTLELDPGKYLILLDRPGTRLPPLFWVVVEPGRTTDVDLSK